MAPKWNARPLSPLNLSPIEYSPSEIILDGSSDEDSPERRQAKKSEREDLGQEYLNNRPPTILTAGLRGPLHDGWPNYWGYTRQQKFNRPYVIPGRGRLPVATASEDSENGEGSSTRQPKFNGTYVIPGRTSLPVVARRSSSSSESSEEETSSENSESSRGSKISERGSEGDSKGSRSRVKTEAPEGLVANGTRAYERSSNSSNTPTPMPHAQRKNNLHTTNPPRYSSSSEDSASEEEVPHKADPAPRLKNAVEESSKTKDGGVKKQTVASTADRSTAMAHRASNNQRSIEIPTNFWVEPVKGLLDIAALAKAMREGLTTLTPERLQQRCQAPSSRSPHVLPPSTSLPEFRYNWATKVKKASRRKSTNLANTAKETSARACSPKNPSSTLEAGPSAEKGQTVGPQPGATKVSGVEVRVPPRPSQDSVIQQSSHEPMTTSDILQDAQKDAQRPSQNIKIPSGPSTNILETDKQSLRFMNSDERESQYGLSTQALMTKAQRSFQLDLESPEKRLTESSPLLSSSRRTRSMGKKDIQITPFRTIRSPYANAEKQGSQSSQHLPATQDLIDKMTPFAITTAKKSSRKRRANSKSSPSKRRATRAGNIYDIVSDSDRISVDTQASPGGPDSDYSPIPRKIRSPGNQSSQSRTPNKVKTSSPQQHSSTHQARNARGQFSNPKSHSQTDAPRQSQPSASKPRNMLRSYPSSQSASQFQQDGQYLHGRWTLSDAIDEAGSYLGTWDVDKEVQKGKRTRNRSSQE